MDNAKLVDAPDERVRAYYTQKELNELARSIAVPINDDDVRRELRTNSQPAEVADESKSQRRNRLIEFLVEKKKNHTLNENPGRGDTKDAAKAEPRVTEGSLDLMKSREIITEFVTKNRGQKSLTRSESLKVSDLELHASQAGFLRPVSAVKLFASDLAVSGDWSGKICVFQLEDSMPVLAEAHAEPISTIATTSDEATGSHAANVHITSGLMNGGILLYELQHRSELAQVLRLDGHRARVSSIEFHPAGSFIVSGSHDKTWRLWDYSTGKCLLEQDGHAERIHVTKTSADGSLLASGGFDKAVRIWDLRSGVSVACLHGHACEVVSAAWHPAVNNPTMELATGSADDRCLIWDLRNPTAPSKIVYAHTSTISDMWFDSAGSTLATASLDSTIRLWDAAHDYSLVRTFNTGSRVTCLDGRSTATGATIVAGRWDRLVDLYKDF